MPDITERIEKQMEGTNLALAAVAEVLQKMDIRLSKEEEASAYAEREDANASAKAELVKSIANEVLTVIKDGTTTEEKGMDVSGKERKAKATGGTPQNADDSESGAAPNTKLEDQQNTILAIKKLLKEYEEGEEADEEEEEKGMAYKQDEEAEEEAADEPVPQISNYLGECILKIANHLSYRPNFINYTYREEMISDGIENCLQYIDRFSPEKSKNPFAYFTQIIHYAFLRIIQK